MNDDDNVHDDYSKSNAERFGWAGFTPAPINQERLGVITRNIIGPKVLDAGCGSGALTDHFSRLGFDVVGLDYHDFCLLEAKNRGHMGHYLKADLTTTLPFRDNEFDTTYCCDVLEHVDDQLVLKELARVTAKRIIFMVPQNATNLLQYGLLLPTYQDPTHLRYYTESMLYLLATSVSPKVVTVYGEQKIPINSLLKAYFSPDSRYQFVGSVYRSISRFLIARNPEPELYMNWVCILDF